MKEYSSELILDSIVNGERITCFRVTYPRIVHSEFMRHRSGSYCSASSRAIPLNRMIDQYVGYTPDSWRRHQQGMQPMEGDVFTESEISHIFSKYEYIKNLSIEYAKFLHLDGLAKEQVNRIIEPYSYITHLVQMTRKGFKHLFELRTDESAQYEFRVIANMMKKQYNSSTPVNRLFHLPFINDEEVTNDNFYQMAMISSARCARTSYYNHEGKVSSTEEDNELASRLLESKHLSPFEFPIIHRFKAEDLFDNIKWWEVIENDRWWKKIEPEDGFPIAIRRDMSGNLNNWKVVQFRKILETIE